MSDSLGNWKIAKTLTKTIVFWRPEVVQDGPKRASIIILGARAVVWRPVLGPSWAILGPPWPFLGGPGRHLGAKFGLGGLDLGGKVAKR